MPASTPTDALAAAGIATARRGRERLHGLTEGERDFYRWILTSFGAGDPPGSDELAEAASRLELELEPALERLRREDLVHRDPATGTIVVAYPFSGRPTAHRVHVKRRTVYAMCALDALGIAPMLGEAIAIASRDPVTGEAIEIELKPDGQGSWQPQQTVIVSGIAGTGGSCDACCPVLNFFASAANAHRWLAARPDVRGCVISLPEAIVAGRTVFGDVLEEV